MQQNRFRRSPAKYVKKGYRVRNWPQYEQGLRNRGSLTVWLGMVDGKLNSWNASKPRRPKPGRQRQYSEHAIETAVTLGMVFGLATRQTEGFLRSLLVLMKLDNEAGYRQRSKVETTFHRYKTIIDPAMRARRLLSQRVEARIGCRILNVITGLGMPDGVMS